MKTASRFFLTLALVLFLAGTTFSQESSTAKTTTKQTTAAPGKFVDTNKNGVCDNHEAKGAGAPGRNFTDKNGDGKCDNFGKSGTGKGVGCGYGPRNGAGCGKGQGKGNRCGQGYQRNGGFSGQGKAPATEPIK